MPSRFVSPRKVLFSRRHQRKPFSYAAARLRIDLLITELNVGGAERCLTDLAIGLDRRGMRVRVASIAPLPSCGPQTALVDRLRAASIEVFSANCGSPRQFWTATKRLAEWLTHDRPDVLQSMLFHANVVASLAGPRAKVRSVVGGIRVAEKRALRLWAEGMAARRMKGIVCVSQSVRRFAERSLGQGLPPLVVIPNAIDVAKVDALPKVDWRELLGAEVASDDVLLMVGRLDRQKGLDTLIKAMRQVFTHDPRIRCVIVGDGPQRRWVESLCASDHARRLHWMGWRADALSLIKSCRLLVLASRYEGMPNVILEAMAAGRPVAATRVEGVEELLGCGAGQQTCSPEDPLSLATLIRWHWDHPQESAALGRGNRALAESGYGIDAMVSSYERFYRSLQ